MARRQDKSGVRIATLRDVARHAGVSHTTVSRVINGDKVVTGETRQLVEDAIAALKFSPNPVARALSGAEHIRVGLLHRFPNPGSLGEFLVHLLHHTTKAHASLIVRGVASPDEHEAAVQELVENRVRAVILPPPLADEQDLTDRLAAAGIAIVATGSHRQSGRIMSVGVDERVAARAMTQHLIAIGHRRIGFIAGDDHYASADLRLAGFRDALAEAGLRADPALVAKGLYTYQSGLHAAERLIGLADQPTAIFASNDDMAAATIAVAHRRGLDVPSDLSVCGYDDSSLATTIWPTLTTIRHPTFEVTRNALHMILSQVTGGKMPEQGTPYLSHTLVRRQSDAPPRGQSRHAAVGISAAGFSR